MQALTNDSEIDGSKSASSLSDIPRSKNKLKKKVKERRDTQTSNPPSPLLEEDGFMFTFINIKNLVLSSYPVEVIISIFFDDKLVESTPPIVIESKQALELEENTLYYRTKDVKQFSIVDKLISTPFIVVLSLVSKEEHHEKKKTQKSRKFDTSEEPEISLASSKGISGTIVGQAVLDVLSLLLGNNYLKEVLTLEPNMAITEAEIPFSSRTQLTVICEPLGTSFKEVKSQLKFRNILTFTIRALYNAELPEFTDKCYCVAVTPMLIRYPKKEKEEDGEEDEEEEEEEIIMMREDVSSPQVSVQSDPHLKSPYSLMIFEPGYLEKTMDCTGLKRWSTSQLIDGGIAYTKERLFDDFMSVKNTIKVDICSKEYSEEPRVYWNMSRRAILTKSMCDAMYKMILKRRVWPVEIAINASGSSVISNQKKKPIALEKPKSASLKDQPNSKPKTPKIEIKHYIAFFDLGDLLYPGIKSTVVSAQLYTFNKQHAEINWGLQEPLMIEWLPSREPKNKTKTDPKTSDNDVSSKEKSATPEKEPEKEPEKALPLFSNNGEPVFLVVDVGLAKPFVKKREFQEIEESIKDLLPLRQPFEETDIGFTVVSRKNFKNCIKNLAEVVAKEYQDFKTLVDSGNRMYEDNDEQDFYDHIVLSGMQKTMVETLKVPLCRYVSDVINLPSSEAKSSDMQICLTHIYSQLVQDMHLVVNECDITSRLKEGSATAEISLDTYLIMAAEADAEHNISKCKYYMLKRLESDISDPQLWIDIAVPLLNYKQYNAALEVIREALFLDARNKEGLLMYGAIMTITGQIEVAELFFDVLTRLYPLFTDGWVAFSAFYNIIGRKEGVDVTLGVANKCEILLEHPRQNLSNFPPLNWTTDFNQFSEVMLIRAAIYMLSLNLHQFVEVCMGEVLAAKKCETTSYHYYLAACHYQQKRYVDSLKHLESIKTLKWADSNLWSLMGNNYYSMKKHKLAKRAYTMAVETSKIGNTCLSTLLSFVRMGFYQLGEHKYEEAYFIFKSVVSQYPTAKTWCGLGIACYRLNHHSDAELALTESNMLDTQCSLTWAYLALINGIRKNANNFEQCARMAIEKGLRASELVEELWNIWQHFIGVTRSRPKLKNLSENELQ